MPLNLTQKLIKAHLSGPACMTAGEEINLVIDQTLTHDITAVMGYLAFMALDIPKVRTQCSVSYLDHNLLYVDSKTPDDHIFLQSVAAKYGLWLSRPGNGICHSVHYARFGIPGLSLLGSDSHTTTAGAIGMLGIGAGGVDVATAMAGQPFPLRMPRVVGVELTGKLPVHCTAKDIVLEMLRRFGVHGGTGKIFEYIGPGAEVLEVPQRATIANMGAEMGATTSVFAADGQVKRFFEAQGRGDAFVPLAPDAGCSYDETVQIDLSSLEPLVACPDMPDNVHPVADAAVQGVKVHQVYIGSCTNASYTDIKQAAMVLKGRTVHPDVSLTVSPATRQIFSQLLREGIIADLVDAGARITEICCGACCGIGQAPPTDGVSLRTSNRNFRGRGGTEAAKLYISGPTVAAASAVTGCITDPRSLMDMAAVAAVTEPECYHVDDTMLIPPREAGERAEVIWGPNIKDLPLATPPGARLSARVSLKAGDNISTDDITPAGAEFSSMRSNIPLIAQYAYSRYDPGFVQRAKDMVGSVIIGGENYGQGSSREHAAISPMFLGVKAVVAKSIARIHRANLVNHGVLPLVFADKADYDALEQGDLLEADAFAGQVAAKRVSLRNVRTGQPIETVLELSDTEIEVLLAGGRLPWLKKKL